MAEPGATPSYWRFALPLVALGPLMQAGAMAQQSAVLGLGSVRELAALALAKAMLDPFANMLGMAPQMGTVLGRDRAGYRAVRQLVLGMGLILLLAVALIAATPLGPAVVGLTFRVDDGLIAIVLEYLLWFAMVIPLMGIHRVASGILVRAHRTGVLTAIKVGQIGAVIAILILGAQLGWAVRATLIASALIPELLAVVVTVGLARGHAPRDDDPELPRTSVAGALRFFAPMAVTTTMFTLSRPILFSVVTLFEADQHRAELMIAALSLAFACGFVFQSVVNNVLRNLMATFAGDDPEGCRRFAIQLTLATTAAALVCLVGPPARWFLATVMQAEGAVLELASQAAPVLALAPLVIAWRNWYHGLAMVHRRTGAMLMGSLARNGCVALGALALAEMGWFDHRTGAALLVAAFAFEAVGTILASRRWRAALAAPLPA